MFLVLLLYALFALIFTLSKLGLNSAEPFFFIGSRMVLASLLLLVYQLYKQQSIKIKIVDLKYFFLFALMACYCCNVSEIWATQHILSAKVCLLYSLSPFVSAVLAYIILNERFNLKKSLGLAIGFIGLLPISLTQTQNELALGQWTMFSYPELAMLMAVISSAYGWILLKQLLAKNYPSILITSFGMGLGGILSLIHSYVLGEPWQPLPVSNWQQFLPIAILVCLISNVLCYNLYGYLLNRFSASFMSFAGLITPIFCSSFGWLFLGEKIGWQYFVAMAIFALGLTIFYQDELAQKKLIIQK